MRMPHHDLLVLTGEKTMSEQELERQVRFLNDLLYNVVEKTNAFCTANEILDVNKCRIVQKPHLVQQIISSDVLPPFVFINSKN